MRVRVGRVALNLMISGRVLLSHVLSPCVL